MAWTAIGIGFVLQLAGTWYLKRKLDRFEERLDPFEDRLSKSLDRFAA